MKNALKNRILALVLFLVFIIEICMPSALFALTGGPSQPEYQGFSQASTSEMVNLATGDFSYNLPLLTVPGPNGGYPINMFYSAGVGMEQEASWVGLGWNLNVGAINRQLRGLPDEFNGEDKITKEFNMKSNVTLGFSPPLGDLVEGEEIFNFPIPYEGINPNVYYNNYTGVGVRVGLKLGNADENNSDTDKNFKSFLPSLSLSYDTQGGLGVQPSLSIGSKKHSKYGKFNISANFNSRYGLMNIVTKHNVGVEIKGKKEANEAVYKKLFGPSTNIGSSISFSAVAPLPGKADRFDGVFTHFELDYGNDVGGVWNSEKKFAGSFTTSFIPNNDKVTSFDAYGYLNSHLAPSSGGRVMDFYYSKDHAMTPKIPNLPVPIATYDTYSISGQRTGGAFRAMRSDLGIYSEESNSNSSVRANGGIEVAGTPPNTTHIGVNVGLGMTNSYSGRIIADAAPGMSEKFKFESISTIDPSAEPFYFKSMGELTRTGDWYEETGGETPLCFDISLAPFDGIAGPKISQTSNILNVRSTRGDRQVRSQSIEYRYNDDLQKILSARQVVNPNASQEAFLSNSNNELQSFDYTQLPTHHIGEYIVTNPDGTTYHYGLPVYNNIQKSVAFAINGSSSTRRINYDQQDASLDNNQGSDHFFSSDMIDPYAYCHLLTKVVSHDYVDLTGDGPTEDDFGYYTKFNYSKLHNDFKWRSPFSKAFYSDGEASNPNDNKANYSYGEKEIYYLHSIETKTHIARITLVDRLDNRPPAEEFQNMNEVSSGDYLKAIKKIELFNKSEPNIPVQTVHFEYDYSLCQGVPNNDTSESPSDPICFPTGVNEGGKLTLKKVYFTYSDSNKGKQSPYVFNYDVNPSYDESAMNRWGNYYPTPSDSNSDLKSGFQSVMSSHEHPYISPYIYHHTQEELDLQAAAWNMTDIKLPSGGLIEIEYEKDDYGLVQDKKAMHMYKVLGTGTSTGPKISEYGQNSKKSRLRKNDLRIYFMLEEDQAVLANMTESEKEDLIKRYLRDQDHIYFKTWQRVKRLPGDPLEFAQDYVEGYAKLDQDGPCGIDLRDDFTNSSAYIGYFTVEEIKYGAANAFSAHPFRMAGWQYLRMQRPDLFIASDPTQASALSFDLITQVLNIISSATDLIFGYYNAAATKNYNKYIYYDKPSFVRLTSPDLLKHGGGHRVKSITTHDNWIEGAASYTTTYTYRKVDGSSSGVSEYEPLLGGEENPLNQPIWYNQSDKPLNLKSEEMYIQDPICEDLYPAANVIYSRVIVQQETPEGVGKTGAPILVHEFYTSEDFPIRIKAPITKPPVHYKYQLPVPLVGNFEVLNQGYSQGYTVVLNNMHGVPKAVRTYAYGSMLVDDGSLEFELSSPKAYTEYRYRTDELGRLSSSVPITESPSMSHYHYENIGLTHDLIISNREFQSISTNQELNSNVEAIGVIPFLLAYLSGGKTENTFRSIVTCKVINVSGILQETTSYLDGSYTTQRNLVYDPNSGQPLLTSVTNDFGEKVYTMRYPAYWGVEGMRTTTNSSGYKFFDLMVDQAGMLVSSGPSYSFDELLVEGDQLLLEDDLGNARLAWVVSTTSNEVTTMDINGETLEPTSSGSETVTVLKSACRNMQSVMAGSVEALDNPLLSSSPFANELAEILDGLITNPVDSTVNFTACDGSSQSFSIDVFDDLNGTDGFSIIVGGETIDVPFPNSWQWADFSSDGDIQSIDVDIINLPDDEAIIHITIDGTDGEVSTAETIVQLPNSFTDLCPRRVLNASATQFMDSSSDNQTFELSYNFADLQQSSNTLLAGENSEPIEDQLNPYRYGRKNIWRPVRTFAYQVDRLQSDRTVGTNISRDGEFGDFYLFDWQTDAVVDDNPNWDWASNITLFHPDGFPLEEQDALGIYSAELYGYNNSLVTAVSRNSRHQEVGFDGFEEQDGTSYEPSGHLTIQNATTVSNDYSHTGYNSLHMGGLAQFEIDVNQNQTEGNFRPYDPASPYLFSCWIYTRNGGDITISVYDNSLEETLSSISTTEITEPEIDGWTRVTLVCSFPDLPLGQKIKINNSSGQSVYIDDLRIHPFNASMETFVYDRSNQRLLCKLDDNNFGTFYNYNKEGAMVQVKQETERGVFTVSGKQQSFKISE